jgi:hypothetical protein
MRPRIKPGPRLPRLPATIEAAQTALVEGKALAEARDHIRALKVMAPAPAPWSAEMAAAPPGSWFSREESRRWVKRWMKWGATDPHQAEHICNLARAGWGLADEAVREVIVEHRQGRQPLLTSLEAYDIGVVQGAGYPRNRRGGREKGNDILRDLAIVSLVYSVCRMFGLSPTRNTASKRLSGCSIVAKALEAEGESGNISEAAVAKIWSTYSWIF